MPDATYPAGENAYPDYGGGGTPQDSVKDGGVDKISAGTVAPTPPTTNDLWIDTN